MNHNFLFPAHISTMVRKYKGKSIRKNGDGIKGGICGGKTL